ncbi:dipicolinate synthase subunit DpsA [Defluviitalea phaphyphila]|uniref:dipicolinate synthase subunit DpsA n=1 Tax=Defluviitalea phaphyphila TaxID=1473580 RepID=UPI000730C6F9|nr:dipicolinate synthase subunit DpsA [Defluviitalea phaphyphila]
MKFKKRKFAIVGGDLRQIKLSQYLSKKGYEVSIFGFDKNKIELKKNIMISPSLKKTMEDIDIVIGPIPCSRDNTTLFTKYYEGKILLKDLFKCIPRDKIFMAGNITPEMKIILDNKKVKVIDLLKREELAILNAIPTGEGAIQYAMENSDITLNGSECLVLGYGRCGKVLANMLKGLGANTTVEARNFKDLAYIKSYGYKALHLKDLKKHIGKFDFIFNTIPSLILNKEILNEIKENALIIDLASKPGGVDYDAAKELGIKAISVLSLPGKVAPESAALIIYNTIFNVCAEMGVTL